MHPCRFQRPVISLLLVISLGIFAAPATAGDPTPYTARQGLDLAKSAAQSWAEDARLVYVENDEDVTIAGKAGRWGYLFFSDRQGKARGYTIREGKILEASDLGFDFEGHPLSEVWVDSDTAFKKAEDGGGRKYREKNQGELTAMLLIRGAFHVKNADMTTWAMVYTSPSAPAMWVVVNAKNGDVELKWKG